MKGDRFILGKGIDAADIRMETVGEGEVDDPIDGAKRNSGFGPIPGEGIEPLPPTPC
jgi:hypothetical protein